MIFARMEGRNGNQMFVFAAAYALAKRMGQRVFFDCISNYENNRINDTFTLDFFPEVRAFLDDISLRRVKTEIQHLVSKYFADDCGHIFENQKDLTQLLCSFTPATLIQNKVSHLFLHGFFQNERYFTDADGDIRRFFRFPEPPDSQNRDLYTFLKSNDNTVSVSIRRGDFVSDAEAVRLFGNNCPVQYYQKAFETIGEQIPDPVFVFFSDEPEWIKNNFPVPKNSIFVDWNTSPATSYWDMYLISACHHNILSNSTFCWWGAWLGGGKIVIAPPRWFNDERYAALDKGIVPERWLRIDYRL